jgi:hypothetical protein
MSEGKEDSDENYSNTFNSEKEIARKRKRNVSSSSDNVEGNEIGGESTTNKGEVGASTIEGKETASKINCSMPTDSLARVDPSRVKGTTPTESFATNGAGGNAAAAEPSVAPPKSVVVEIPEDSKEGELFYISSEKLGNMELIAIKVPPMEYILAGKEPGNGNIRRYINIVLPRASSPPSTPRRGRRRHNSIEAKSPSIRFSPRHQNRRRSSRQQVAEKKKAENGKVGIGPLYQALPSQLPNASEYNASPREKGLYDQIWDPNFIETKLPQHERDEIYNVLDNIPTNQKELMMESLHKCNYNLDMAWPVMLKRVHELKADGNLPGESLSEKIMKTFYSSIWNSRKDVVASIKTVQKDENVSKGCLLVDYYRNFKPGHAYKTMKETKKTELDYCLVCQDGGVLICCDDCSGTYHLKCLQPPLESIPEENWFCAECIKKESAALDMNVGADPKIIDISSGSEDLIVPIDTPKKRKKEQQKSNVDSKWTYWGINYHNTD